MRFSKQYTNGETVLLYNTGVNVGARVGVVSYKGIFMIASYAADGTHVTILGKEGVVSRLAGTPVQLSFTNAFKQSDVDLIVTEATVTSTLGASIVNTSVLISSLPGFPTGLTSDGLLEPVTNLLFENDPQTQAIVLQLAIAKKVINENGLNGVYNKALNNLISTL